MGCFVVAEFLLTSASRGPSAIAEPLVSFVDVSTGEDVGRNVQFVQSVDNYFTA